MPGVFSDIAPKLPQIEGYEVLEEIGRGGNGVVYRARQRAAGSRVVALKVMIGEAFAGAAELRRFEREVEIASDLNHPNIARIYDSGLAHGRHYFVMEYIEGQALDNFCKSRNLPLKDRLRLFTAVCEAVAFAHRRGVIHRDLKPSNIKVNNEGVPYVLDFGLAKTQSTAEDAELRSMLTMDGLVLGTLPYMAPEQAEGKVSAIDTRTDVYALGVILYELLTGKYPYEVTGQMAEVLKRIAESEPNRPSTVNRLIGDEVETIILRALQKLPDRRYSGADDLARDVAHFLAHEPIEAKRDSGLYVLRKTMRRYRGPLAFAAAIIVLLAASSVISFRWYRRAEAQRKAAETAKAEEQEQRRNAETLRQEATVKARENAWRLAQRYFNEGKSRWFDGQDPVSASACFAEALRVAPEPFHAARTALYNATRECCQMICCAYTSCSDIRTIGGASRPTSRYSPASFSPDGKRLVTASRDQTARVWEAETGQPVSAPMRHEGTVMKASFSPDGKRVLTVSSDGTAQVWDATTGQPVSAPIRFAHKVYNAMFSPDGKWVLTRSEDGKVQIWEATSGLPVCKPWPHDGTVHAAAYDPDGKRIVTAERDAARIWLIDDVDWDEPADLIQVRVRARLGVAVASTGDVQPLTAEELAAAWSEYLRLQADYERTKSVPDSKMSLN